MELLTRPEAVLLAEAGLPARAGLFARAVLLAATPELVAGAGPLTDLEADPEALEEARSFSNCSIALPKGTCFVWTLCDTDLRCGLHVTQTAVKHGQNEKQQEGMHESKAACRHHSQLGAPCMSCGTWQ